MTKMFEKVEKEWQKGLTWFLISIAIILALLVNVLVVAAELNIGYLILVLAFTAVLVYITIRHLKDKPGDTQ